VLEVLNGEMVKLRETGAPELTDLLIAYKWNDRFGGFDRDLATVEWSKS
jgi:hypothetical protein